MPLQHIASYTSSFGRVANDLSFTVPDTQVGDLLILKAAAETSNQNFAITHSGHTWTPQVVSGVASQCEVGIWSVVLTTSGTQTITVDWPDAGQSHSGVVNHYRGAVVGTVLSAFTGQSAPSASFSGAQVTAGSILDWATADWSAVAGSATYRGTGNTEELRVGTAGTDYIATFAHTTAAGGAQSVGLSAPTGQSATITALEVKDASAAGPVQRVAVTTGAPTVATSFTVTLPSHQAGDKLSIIVTGKYAATNTPTINQGWTLVDNGSGGTGGTGNDVGTMFYAIYQKIALSSSETAPTITAGAIAPNSWEWIAVTHRLGANTVWRDAIIGLQSSLVSYGQDTTTGSPLTATGTNWAGLEPTDGDAIFAVGCIPTDLGTALGATTLTVAGLSGGTKSTATTQYIENALGQDTAAVWADWTGFTGTATAGAAMSFTVTGATNQSGLVFALAVRSSPAATTHQAAVAMTTPSTLTAGATVTPGAPIHQAASSMTALSTLTVAAVRTAVAVVSMTAPSNLTTAATRETFATVAMTVPSTLVAAGVRTTAAAVAMTVPSSLTAVGVRTQLASVAMTAPSSLVVSAVREALAAVAMTAPSVLTADATVSGPVVWGTYRTHGSYRANLTYRSQPPPPIEAGALMSTPSTLIVAATRVASASVAMTAPSVLTVAAVRTTAAVVSMVAPSALVVAAVRTTQAVVSMTASSVLVAGAVRTTAASVAMTTPSALAVTAVRVTTATVAMSVPSSLVAAATAAGPGAVSMSTPSTLAVTAQLQRFGVVTMTAPSSLTAGAVRATGATVQMTVPSILVAAAVRTTQALVAMTVPSSLTGAQLIQTYAAVYMTAFSTLIAEATVKTPTGSPFFLWNGVLEIPLSMSLWTGTEETTLSTVEIV